MSSYLWVETYLFAKQSSRSLGGIWNMKNALVFRNEAFDKGVLKKYMLRMNVKSLFSFFSLSNPSICLLHGSEFNGDR